MAEAEGHKRLQPRMSRGGFRIQFVLWSIMAGLQMVIMVGNLLRGIVWDLGEYLALSVLILAVTYRAFLLHVRHHDGHFWDEEEAIRADWDRRGRALSP
ncbi:hypothetical protein [Arthrobacter sp. ZGTC131]|uniref:hypothetical protein n=1 Tax=Arthrobacter sp. ZGTC131 TaxID=2058898 RepID=UPI000CE30EC9|nr:hypothetical protein [Arthrobacter sp. ZGTC131]